MKWYAEMKHVLQEPRTCVYRYSSITDHSNYKKTEGHHKEPARQRSRLGEYLSCIKCLPPRIMLTVTRNKMQLIDLICDCTPSAEVKASEVLVVVDDIDNFVRLIYFCCQCIIPTSTCLDGFANSLSCFD